MSNKRFRPVQCWDCDRPLTVFENEDRVYLVVQCLTCGAYEPVKADLDPIPIVNRKRRRGPTTFTEIQLRHGGGEVLEYPEGDEQ